MKAICIWKQLIIFSAIFLSACQSNSIPSQHYGLGVARLELDSEALARLNSTVTAKVPVGGKIRLDKTWYRVGISYSGRGTLDDYKKSYELTFSDNSRYRGRSHYRLSAQSSDSTGVKSVVGFAAYRAMGFAVPDIEPVVLYLNGVFQGLYHLLEPVDSEFYQVRGLTVANLLKAKYGNASFSRESLTQLDEAFDAKIDPETTYDLRQFIEAINTPSTPESDATIANFIDLDSFFSYIATTVLLNQWDGFTNNFFIYRAISSLKFAWSPWDLDRLQDTSSEQAVYQKGTTIFGQGRLCERIFSVPSWRTRYLEVLQHAHSQTLSLSGLLADIEAASVKIAEAFSQDMVLSRDGRTAAHMADGLKTQFVDWYDRVGFDLDHHSLGIK